MLIKDNIALLIGVYVKLTGSFAVKVQRLLRVSVLKSKSYCHSRLVQVQRDRHAFSYTKIFNI